MENILLIIFVILDLIYLFIIVDIILSWLSFFGINFRVEFIKSILEPIYESIKKIVPTTIGPFELAPIIVIFIMYIIRIILVSIDPNIYEVYKQIINQITNF